MSIRLIGVRAMLLLSAATGGALLSVAFGVFSAPFVFAQFTQSITEQENVPAKAHQPQIIKAWPETGGRGQYVTLEGKNFGAIPGSVTFERKGESIPASTDFPTACRDGRWRNAYVIIKVPSRIATGQYRIVLKNSSGVTSNDTNFVVTDASPTPGVCAAIPDNGPAGIEVSLYGERFGTTPGRVNVGASEATVVGNQWASTYISLVTPMSGTDTGRTRVVDAGNTLSNPVIFSQGRCTLGQCGEGQACCMDGSCRRSGTCHEPEALCSYAWTFTTGKLANTGSACESEKQCLSGICGSDHRCAHGGKQLNESCKFDEECAQQLGCQKGACTPLYRPLGESCNANAECMSGLCNQVCVQGLKDLNGACTSNDQCRSNTCLNKVCAQPLSVLKVVSIDPKGSGVARNAVIKITFNQLIKYDSVPGSVIIRPDVKGTWAYYQEGASNAMKGVAEFRPLELLAANTRYSITATQGVKSYYGNLSLDKPFTGTISSGAEICDKAGQICTGSGAQCSNGAICTGSQSTCAGKDTRCTGSGSLCKNGARCEGNNSVCTGVGTLCQGSGARCSDGAQCTGQFSICTGVSTQCGGIGSHCVEGAQCLAGSSTRDIQICNQKGQICTQRGAECSNGALCLGPNSVCTGQDTLCSGSGSQCSNGAVCQSGNSLCQGASTSCRGADSMCLRGAVCSNAGSICSGAQCPKPSEPAPSVPAGNNQNPSTGNDVTMLEDSMVKIQIDGVAKTSDLFSVKDQAHAYRVTTGAINANTLAIRWSVVTGTGVVELTNPQNVDDIRLVTAKNNGRATIKVTVSQKYKSNGVEKDITSTKSVASVVDFCDELWSYGTNAADGNDAYDFEWSYCKKRGEKTLPALKEGKPQVVPVPREGVEKEYLFRFNDSNDTIAVRIYKNQERYSPLLWYAEKGPQATSTSSSSARPIAPIDNFQAVGDEYGGVYVNTIGKDGSPYIVFITMNTGAESSTRGVFRELLSRVHFAKSVGDSRASAMVRNDVVRISDINDIAHFINLKCGDSSSDICRPRLTAGSYLPGQTISIWPSWQSTLGNALGAALPLDPYHDNALPCASPFDAKTCWNVAAKTFYYTDVSRALERIHAYTYQWIAASNQYKVCARLEDSVKVSYTNPIYCKSN